MRPNHFEHQSFQDYALLDSGGGEKLERFGPVVLRRPDPQALWNRRLEEGAWERADLRFERESDRGGRWIARRGAHKATRGEEPQWNCRFREASFLVRPTPFKHVGVFPEQAANWRLVAEARQLFSGAEPPQLLNLFGYTGVASVLAAQAGYQVTHVDASKTSIAWLSDNAEASGIGRKSMRLICDDALVFAKREVRRGSRYQVVLLDPPAYGRGPKGEKWRFEESIAPIMTAVRELLGEQALLILSSYAIGYSPLAFFNLLTDLEGGEVAAGELALPEENGERFLPAGYCARFWRGLDNLAGDR